jgi:hypothetical protein
LVVVPTVVVVDPSEVGLKDDSEIERVGGPMVPLRTPTALRSELLL